MNTGLGLFRLKDELCLAAFLRHRVIRIHGDGSVSIPVRSDADAEHRIVSAINRSCQSEQYQQPNPE